MNNKFLFLRLECSNISIERDLHDLFSIRHKKKCKRRKRRKEYGEQILNNEK
jgi:hypothetical protein